MTLDFVQQIVKFVGGKFRDSSVDHGNNENWHPTKITRYTVFSLVPSRPSFFFSYWKRKKAGTAGHEATYYCCLVSGHMC